MEIDFVVTWVDSNDTNWQKEFQKYKGITNTADQSKARYRDWDFFKYWFRAVDKYAPWVHKVYVITNGTFPSWINSDCSKLVLVKHSDYIPHQFLPTFNSRTIEFYMNRIQGLSEHFVYFNDDMYLNAPVSPEYYFKNGLPCDNNAETVYNMTAYNPSTRFHISVGLFVNVCVINGHFDRRKVMKQSRMNWYGIHLSIIDRVMSFIISRYHQGWFIGFRRRHIEQPYLKSIFDDAWEKESGMLTESSTRFREDATLTPYFFRYWQFASNKFYPVRLKEGRKILIIPEKVTKILECLKDKRIKSLCLNDTQKCSDDDYGMIKPILVKAFEEKFPNKSIFEK